MTEVFTGPKVSIRPATEADAGPTADIYNQGIEDRVATDAIELRLPENRCTWLRSIVSRYRAFVAEVEGQVVGWAGAGPYRTRECYRGFGEFSLYVRREGCGNCCPASSCSMKPAKPCAGSMASAQGALMKRTGNWTAVGSMW